MKRRLSTFAMVMAFTGAARAADPPPPDPQATPASAHPPPRVHDLVEVGVGALTLPSVKLCIATNCTTTDLTLLLSFRNLVRFEKVWAVGAGVAWGFRPVTADASMRATDGSLIEREHTRNYFMVSGMARRYVVNRERFEMWLGATGGLVITSDRYSSAKTSESIIGPKANAIRTEGIMGGAGLGAAWSLSESFNLGLWTTEMLWKFPTERACAATRECATVSGSLFSFETGVYLTYRVRL